MASQSTELMFLPLGGTQITSNTSQQLLRRLFTANPLTLSAEKLWILNDLWFWPLFHLIVIIMSWIVDLKTRVSYLFPPLRLYSWLCYKSLNWLGNCNILRLKVEHTISNYIVYYIFLPTLTATQDLVRCDTLHITVLSPLLEAELY